MFILDEGYCKVFLEKIGKRYNLQPRLLKQELEHDENS